MAILTGSDSGVTKISTSYSNWDGQTPLAFNFPSFDKSHIYVTHAGKQTTKFEITNYTTGLANNVPSGTSGGGTIVFSNDSPVVIGETILIYRSTPINYFIEFIDGATLSASELNLNNTAAMFRAQEIPTGFQNIGPGGEDGEDGEDGVSVTNASIADDILSFTLSDNSTITAGNVRGPSGLNVTNIEIENDELIFTLSDTTTFNLGSVRGPEGNGLTIKGTLSDVGAPTSTEAPSPEVGDLWLDSAGDGFFYNSNSVWQNIGQIRGPQGLRGDTGSSLNIRGTLDDVGAPTSTEAPSPEEGDLWIDSAGDGFFYNSDSVWQNVGQIRGPQGLQGVGIENVEITNNELVLTFDNGTVENLGNVKGEAGTPATITEVTATSGTTAGVVFGGTPSARTLSFTLPKGDDGNGLTIRGTLDDVGAPIPSEAPSPEVGDLWLDSNGDGFFYNGNTWQNIGPIRGPRGFPGTSAAITNVSAVAGSEVGVVTGGTDTQRTFEFTIPTTWSKDSDANHASAPAINYPYSVRVGTTTYNYQDSHAFYVNGSADIDGTISANKFDGDGSLLTNVNAASLGGSSKQDIISEAGGSSVSISENSPPNSNPGDLWWSNETGRLYILYRDGDDDLYWVDTNPPLPGVPPNFTASVSPLNAGEDPTATISGTAPNFNLALGIPRGDTGSDGVSVTSASITNNRLIIGLSDGSSIDAGAITIPPATFTGGNVPNLTSFLGQSGPDNVAVNMSGSMVFYASNNAQLIGTDTFTIKGNSGIHLYAADARALEISTSKVKSNLDLDVNGIIRSTRSAGSGSAFVGNDNCILSAESGNLIFMRQNTTVGEVVADDWKIYRELEVDGLVKSINQDHPGAGFVGTNNCILSAESGNLIFMRNGVTVGEVNDTNWTFNSQVKAANLPTSPNVANVFATTNGKLRRSSSSRRYKNTIEDYDADSAYKFLKEARPVTYLSNSDEDWYQHIGFIAEEIDEVEPRYIHYNEDGAPDGVQYAAMVATLTKICQMQEQRIKALEDRLNDT